MKYTEEDIRKAFQAGLNKGSHQSYFDAPLDENEYIEALNQAENNEVLDPVIQRAEKVCWWVDKNSKHDECDSCCGACNWHGG